MGGGNGTQILQDDKASNGVYIQKKKLKTNNRQILAEGLRKRVPVCERRR